MVSDQWSVVGGRWPVAGKEAPATDYRLLITDYRRNSLTLSVQTDRPAWLVLADVNYPGWTATISDRPTPIYTAYYLLRAVPLDAGSHRVVFTYRPGWLLPALLLSLSSLLAILLAVLWPWVRRLRATTGRGGVEN